MSLSARDAARLAVLVAVAATLQVAESLVPKPLPWLRLGLANGVTLLVLVRMGFPEGLALTVLRIGLGGLLLGTLGSPAFFLSAAGGLGALLAMAISLRLASPPLSLLGVSVLGAACHAGGQLAVFSVVFGVGRPALVLLPWLLATSVPVGLVTGGVILAVHRRLAAW